MQETMDSQDCLLEEVYIAESLLVAIFWNMPSLFSTYTAEKISYNHVGNKIWKFYLGLGRELFNRGIQVFDDITVSKIVKELNCEKQYKKFGEYETIEELMIATKGSEENFETHFEEVKKYSLLRALKDLLGEKVIKKTKKYDYHKMTRQEIDNYWSEKLIQIQISNGDTKIKEYNLVENLDKLILKLDSDDNVGLPFYNLENYTGIMNGWVKGVVYLMSAFSGMGKSSFIVYAIIMACIKHKEKLVIIANEMDIEAYQKLLIVSVLGSPLNKEMYEKYNSQFNRNVLDKGKFTERDRERINYAVNWIKQNVKDNELIKFIPIEHYTMEAVEQVLRFYKRKGYDFAVIDTCKPSENRGSKERWVQFVDDFETIYKLAKKDSLDMGLFCTVQNADSYINVKFLDYSCIGDGKKIKNTVDVVTHIRTMHEDEKKGDKALVVKDDNGKQVKLNGFKTYYLLFVSKNRRGMTNSSLPVLVMEVDLNTNTWVEIGWTKVANDLQS
jgi:replicative DNA helicase